MDGKPTRQEHWSGWPCPPPGDLPNPGTEPVSLTSPALAGGFFTTSATWEAPAGRRKQHEKATKRLPDNVCKNKELDDGKRNYKNALKVNSFLQHFISLIKTKV